MRHLVKSVSYPIIAVLAASLLVGCPTESQVSGDARIRLDTHPVLPPLTGNVQRPSGSPTGYAPEQPIQFPHYTHVITLEMECEYCHAEARKSIHSGVPPTQTCMGCHENVKTDSPEIKRVTKYYTDNQPIPWQKVHDLSDFVYFAHKRHVQPPPAGPGLQCTECHGQVGLQGKPKLTMSTGPDGVVGIANIPEQVMVRESTMQMGWCIQCHNTHPSIDQNYGDQANLRRAELKDCWTCHK